MPPIRQVPWFNPSCKKMLEISRRNTRQKILNPACFRKHRSTSVAQEVLALAQREVKGLGIATVYRNLKALQEEGTLTSVNLPGGAVLFEAAGKAHHHHFQCDYCHRVFELHGCLPAIDKLAQPKFKVLRHELTLYGLCSDCRMQERTS